MATREDRGRVLEGDDAREMAGRTAGREVRATRDAHAEAQVRRDELETDLRVLGVKYFDLRMGGVFHMQLKEGIRPVDVVDKINDRVIRWREEEAECRSQKTDSSATSM